MRNVQEHTDESELCPADMRLLLRAYAEQQWLSGELEPQVREVERARAVEDEQLGAALAYLEVLWLDAGLRAAQTDAARASLPERASAGCEPLHGLAHRYYEALLGTRAKLSGRVQRNLRVQAGEQQGRELHWAAGQRKGGRHWQSPRAYSQDGAPARTASRAQADRGAGRGA